MSRQFFAGGTYVDATPDGAYAALVGAKLQTHVGPIDLPPGEDALLFVRVTTVGGFQIAGKAHTAAKTWLWQNGVWRSLPDGIGVSPLIFDRLGILHISDGSIGSQGWRYVADDGTIPGRLVTGDQTYGSPYGLSEWSAVADLQIGQGHDGGGVCVWDGAALRLLEAGDCRFVRVQGDGPHVAVSFWKVGQGAVVYQTTLAELHALPLLAAPVPVPVPVPVHEDDMVTPKIDVQHYDPQIQRGQPWQAEFTIGGQTSVLVRIGADGNLTIGASNQAGADRTGRVRHIEVA